MAFSVDTQHVQDAGADIQRIAAQIEESVAAMTGRLAALQGTWTGAASQQFQGCVQDWNALQARVRTELAEIGRATVGAGADYQHTEDAVRGLFSR